MFWPLSLVKIITVPKEIVIQQVPVRVPVYEQVMVGCKCETRMDWIRAELVEIRKLVQVRYPEPITVYPDELIAAAFNPGVEHNGPKDS